eukprot:scaffold47_cov334-Pavlova_lutheri.AAC.56
MAVILTPDLVRVVIQQTLHSLERLPVELDVGLLSLRIEQDERVHPEPFHVTVIAWDANIIQQKREHVTGLWVVRQEVHDPPRLLHVALGIGLEGMDHVRELHAITYEKHRHVVAHQVPIALPRVELDRESSRVSQGLGRPALVHHGTEPHDDRGLYSRCAEQICARQVGDVMRDFEEALGRSATSMDHSLRDPFAVKLSQFFQQVIVIQEDGTSLSRSKGIVVVPYRCTAVGGPIRAIVCRARSMLRSPRCV